MLTKSWKKSFSSGVVIPPKRRFCKECNDKRVCNRCNIGIIENKEFEAIINLIKRKAPNEFGHMLPH